MINTELVVTKGQVVKLLRELLSRSIRLDTIATITPHPATYRGVVNDDNVPVAVIAADIDFAHTSAAALAMIPASIVEEKGDKPDPDLIDMFCEVANVLSRLVNEAHPTRLRIDPGIEFPTEELQAIMDSGRVVVQSTISIEGYGSGDLGIWYKPV